MADVVVIEDEALVGELVVMNLERAGHVVRHASSIAEARTLIDAREPELMIADAMLPDGTGFDLVAAMRTHGRRFPVLMLTSLADAASKVRGLDAGADDYLPKPFDVTELLARVRALLRRGSSDTRTAVLLVNVGSPASTSVADVRSYLAEFLSDPRVIDTHPVARWLLLHGIILRTRPKKSAALYRSIWTDRGSPLIVFSQEQCDALQRKLNGVVVRYAMRYGAPELTRVVHEISADHLLVVPLYPQFSLAATQSAIDAVEQALATHPRRPQLTVLPAFYDEPGFIDAYAATLTRSLAEAPADAVLFSYHGLPKHQVGATCNPATGLCLPDDGCARTIGSQNANCYRAQCYETTRLIVQSAKLALPFETAFQSRLRGRPWIEPFSDATIDALAARGVKRLLVVCPSFVTDCLETLDEVGNRFKAQFLAKGGIDLRLVPALNSEPHWIDALERMCRRALAAKPKVAAA